MERISGGVARLGVMGGTFDPIHMGHLIIASEALHELRLDRMVFMPTGRPWQKKAQSSSEDRYLMTVLGTGGNPRFAVSRMELDRVGPTYTADTMQQLKDFHGPQTELFFIAGADAVLKLGTWERIESLAELAEIVAVTRPGFALEGLDPQPGWPPIRMMPTPGLDISSTDIRARVAHGRPIDYLVPAEVVTYIREHGLYMNEEGDAVASVAQAPAPLVQELVPPKIGRTQGETDQRAPSGPAQASPQTARQCSQERAQKGRCGSGRRRASRRGGGRHLPANSQ